MKQVLNETLYFQQGSSDKVYKAEIISVTDSSFIVNFAYGRRGAALKSGTKTNTPVSYDKALSIYTSLLKSKTSKGYTPGDSVTSMIDISNPKEPFDLVPQLLVPIPEDKALHLIYDDNYAMQQKMNGERLLVKKSGDEITGGNKKGLQRPINQELYNSLKSYDDMLIDGEIIGDILYVFDILSLNAKNLKNKTFYERYTILSHLKENPYLKIVKTFFDSTSKKLEFDRLLAAGEEGVVFKDVSSKYKSGRSSPKGATQMKYKFYATCSCVVTSVSENKRSVSLGLLDESNTIVDMGKVTIPANHNIPKSNDIVEVRYLYAYPNGSLFQTTYLGLRNDVDKEECLTTQLKYKP